MTDPSPGTLTRYAISLITASMSGDENVLRMVAAEMDNASREQLHDLVGTIVGIAAVTAVHLENATGLNLVAALGQHVAEAHPEEPT